MFNANDSDESDLDEETTENYFAIQNKYSSESTKIEMFVVINQKCMHTL